MLNLMDDKNSRLDFGAPLLSVRRFSSEPEPTNSKRPNPVTTRSALPFYKSDLKSGPIRDPGVIPFLWEQSPGHPKPSPAKIKQPEPANDEDEGEEKFCDALDALSCTESVFLNCSVSGISEAQEAASSGSFSTDARVRDFMMGRFLPAAQAMAAESASTARKSHPQNQERGIRRVVAVESGEQRRVRYPMDCEHGVGLLKNEEEEEEEEEVMRLRGCGLIPRFCLLNPVPGMRVSNGRLRGTSVRRVRPGGGGGGSTQQVRTVLHDRCILKAEEENSWEAVYKHKITHGNPPTQGEDVNKLTSESNHLTCSSDSLTADGSSPQHHGNINGIYPYRNEPSQSPFHEGKGFLGVPRRVGKDSKTDRSNSFEKSSDDYCVLTPQNSNQCGSGYMSTAVDRTLHVDTVLLPETPISKSSSLDNSLHDEGVIKSADENSEVGVQRMRMGEISSDVLQFKVTETEEEAEPATGIESSACGATDENHGFRSNANENNPLFSNENNQMKNNPNSTSSILPPPLPNSPTESWLTRALPSASSKNQPAQSFLGMNFQPRKQASTPLVASKEEIQVKPLKVRRSQTRFADMLAIPLSPRSEI